MTEQEMQVELEGQLRRAQGSDLPEIAQLLSSIDRAPYLTNFHRSRVYPVWNDIGFFEVRTGKLDSVSVAHLFNHRDIPQERLHEVYAFEVLNPHLGEEEKGYTGDFAPNGQQALADILGKPILFIRERAQFMLDLSSMKVVIPEGLYGESRSPRWSPGFVSH